MKKSVFKNSNQFQCKLESTKPEKMARDFGFWTWKKEALLLLSCMAIFKLVSVIVNFIFTKCVFSHDMARMHNFIFGFCLHFILSKDNHFLCKRFLEILIIYSYIHAYISIYKIGAAITARCCIVLLCHNCYIVMLLMYIVGRLPKPRILTFGQNAFLYRGNINHSVKLS